MFPLLFAVYGTDNAASNWDDKKISGHKSCKSGETICQFVTWPKLGYVTLRVAVSHEKSPPCLVWCQYRSYLKESPGLNEHPLEWAPILTAEKFNERSGLNERHPQTWTGALIWKFATSAEALIQIFCKNDETRIFFSQIFFVFYNKEIFI